MCRESMHTVHCQPFIEIFSFGQLDGLPQTPTPQSGLCKLSQLVAARPLGCRAGFEGALRSRISGRCQHMQRPLESLHSGREIGRRIKKGETVMTLGMDGLAGGGVAERRRG